MKISTNCSPLVIYFGFFFQTKQSHSQREGASAAGLGGSERLGAEQEKGGTEGTSLRIEVCSHYGERWFGGSRSTRPSRGRKARVCSERRYRVSSGHLRPF